MTYTQRTWGFRSVIAWTLVTTLGWAVGWAPLLGDEGMLLVGLFALTHSGDVLVSILQGIMGVGLGAIGGAIVGTGQWLVLRYHFGTRAYWLAATAVSMVIGWACGGCATLLTVGVFVWDRSESLATSTANNMGVVMSGATLAAIVGLFVGLWQRSALRGWVRNSGSWVIVSLLAWAVAGAVFWAVYLSLGGPLSLPQSARPGQMWSGQYVYYRSVAGGWIAGGICLGLITGIRLKSLLEA